MSEEELPEGWAATQLHELLKVGGLFDGPFGSNLKTSDYTDSGVRVVRLENLANLRFVEAKRTFISRQKYATLRKHTVVAGDVLFGSFVDGPVRVCLMPPVDTPAIAKADCFCVRPRRDLIDRRFLVYELGRSATRDALVGEIHGATRPRVTTKQLRELDVLLAPLVEQRRIVAKVEALLAQVNAACERLAKVPTILKRFRQAVLAAAFSGKLTEDWREQNKSSPSAADLLEDVRQRRREHWVASQTARFGSRKAVPGDLARRYPEPAPPERTDLVEAPHSWRWTTLAMLAEIVGGITKGQKRRPTDRLRSVPYLRVANVQRGFLDLSEIKLIDATEEETAALRLRPGDLLFTEGGDRDKLGRGWIWGGEIAECIHQNHIFRARLYSLDVQGRFVSWYANSAGQSYFNEEGRQTVNLASINMTKLSSLPIPLPPPEEQREVVRRIEALFALADTIEKRVATATARAQKLPQAILTKAFSGGLVPTEAELARAEGREYEPASVLLERIHAQHNGSLAGGDDGRRVRSASGEQPGRSKPRRRQQRRRRAAQ